MMKVKPLTSKQAKEKASVKESYFDFWNNVKFTKGWAEPRFTRQEVEPLLDIAAEIVVRIRSELDERSPGFKLRMLGGNACEFLWSVDYHPTEFPDNFVNDMVHHTLQDANGYVEDLSFEKVEQYVACIKNYLQEEKSLLENGSKLKQHLKDSLKELQDDVDKLTALEIFETEKLPTQKANALKKLLNEFQDVKEDIFSFISQDAEEKAKRKQEEEEEAARAKEAKEKEEREAKEREEREAKEKEEKERADREREKQQKAEQEEREKKEKEERERLEQEEREKKTKEENEKQQKPAEQKQSGSSDDLQASQGLSKIKIVANDVNRIGNEFKVLKDNTEHLSFEQLVANPRGASVVEDFKKKCHIYSATLMNDLLALDEVMGSQSTRQARKDQVNSIQAMLDEIDQVNNKLQDLAKQLQEKQAKEKVEQPKVQTKAELEHPAPHKEQKERQAQHSQQQHTQSPPQKEEEQTPEEKGGQLAHRPQRSLAELQKERKANILQDKWRQMKLKPKMDVQETKDAYVLVSYIPGLKSEEIQISFSNKDRTVTIEGVRVPSLEEETAMKLKLRQLLEQEYGTADIPEEELETLLLKFAMGRYGRFSETYRVPKNTDLEGISADYQRGILQVIVPKTFSPPPQIHKAHPVRGKPFLGSSQFAPQYFYPPGLSANPYHHPSHQPHQNDFFDDRDYWW